MNIAVIGSITRDRIVIRGRNESFSQVGGGVYYTSMALASIGAKVTAIPLLSKGDADLLDSLDHPNIKTVPQWTETTTTYQNTYMDESLDVCEKKILSKVRGYHPNEILFDTLANCDAVHLTPLSAEEFDVKMFSELRKRFGRTISLDGQGFTKGPLPDVEKTITNNIDIIKLDESEALHVTRQNNETSAINLLSKCGIPHVLITKASKGSTLHYNNDTYSIPAYKPARMIDATGCGDTYIAAYLAKIVDGSSPVESAHFAAQMASKKLENKGALS